MFNSSSWLFNDQRFYNNVATQSLRFDDGSSAYLTRTPSSTGNRRTFTISCWVKRSDLNVTPYIFKANTGTGDALHFRNHSTGTSPYALAFFFADTGQGTLYTTQKFRDTSAWYHIVASIDTTQGTASNRVKLYVNGTQITAFDTANYPSQNYDCTINTQVAHLIGAYASGNSHYDGYMSEFNFVDGSQLTPSSFGETKNGVWIAKKYSGSYGTNGFRLQFNQTGTGTASTSTIGADTSGNNNHYTSSGIVASDCNMIDSPENNFCTLNALNASSNVTVSNGNLTTVTSSAIEAVVATLGVSSGKWYWEVHINANATESFLGITTPRHNNNGASFYDSNQLLFRDDNGSVYYSTLTSRSLPAFEINDIVKIKLDLDNQTMEYSINDGSYVGSITLTDFDSHVAGETWLPTTKVGASGGVGSFNHTYNFGQDSSFAGTKTAQGNTDANGIGDFYYAPPSGYLALCTANLPEPTISPNALTQADDYFNTVLYTGTGSTQTINTGFSTDFTWIKSRSTTNSHLLADSSRGSTKVLLSNGTNAEITDSNYTTFVSNGFSVSGNGTEINNSSGNYVSWNWKAKGGVIATNTAGSITSGVQANTDAGFSIVTYTGNGSAGATVGHSLGTKPEMIILKERNAGGNWVTYHEYANANAQNGYIALNSTLAWTSNLASWNNTSPTSSVFTLGNGTDVNTNNHTMLAYCFHSVEGYSKFGSYTGNSSTNGTFVYTGFKPAWVMVKYYTGSGANHWWIWDSVRNTFNVVDEALVANLSVSTQSPLNVDFVSNGFKFRTSNSEMNGSSASYIYMAFAETPFKYSTAR